MNVCVNLRKKKQNTCKQKNSETKMKKTFSQSPLLEAMRKFLASVVGNNKKKRRFWVFYNEKKVSLIRTRNDW